MNKEKFQQSLQSYFDCISDRNYEKYFELLLPELQDKISISDLDYIFGSKDSEEISHFDLINVEEENDYYKDYTDYEDAYKVQVFFPKCQNLQDESSNEKQNLINLYNAVDNNGNLITKFKCKTIEYHDSGGRVRLVKFEI